VIPRSLADDKRRFFGGSLHATALSLLDDGDVTRDDVKKGSPPQQRQRFFRAEKESRTTFDLNSIDEFRMGLFEEQTHKKPRLRRFCQTGGKEDEELIACLLGKPARIIGNGFSSRVSGIRCIVRERSTAHPARLMLMTDAGDKGVLSRRLRFMENFNRTAAGDNHASVRKPNPLVTILGE
jgi:hypothetical protein